MKRLIITCLIAASFAVGALTSVATSNAATTQKSEPASMGHPKTVANTQVGSTTTTAAAMENTTQPAKTSQRPIVNSDHHPSATHAYPVAVTTTTTAYDHTPVHFIEKNGYCGTTDKGYADANDIVIVDDATCAAAAGTPVVITSPEGDLVQTGIGETETQ